MEFKTKPSLHMSETMKKQGVIFQDVSSLGISQAVRISHILLNEPTSIFRILARIEIS